MKWNIFYLFFLTLLFSCGTDTPVKKEAKQVNTPVNEDDLLTRLSMQLISNPQLQAHHDQNTIVNYAIGELLDVQKTPSGLYYQILEEGSSEEPLVRWGDIIHVQYRGSFLDGRVFDQSKARQPLKIKLRQVIPGWQEAIPMLKKGGKGIFLIPSHLAYGEKGFSNKVPPNSVLKFEMELVEVERY